MSDNRFDPNKLYTPADPEFATLTTHLSTTEYKGFSENGWNFPKVKVNPTQLLRDIIGNLLIGGEKFLSSPEYQEMLQNPKASLNEGEERFYYLQRFVARVLYGDTSEHAQDNPIIRNILRWDQTTYGAFPNLIISPIQDFAMLKGDNVTNVTVYNRPNSAPENVIESINFFNRFYSSLNIDVGVAFPGVSTFVIRLNEKNQQILGFKFSNPQLKALFFGETKLTQDNFVEVLKVEAAKAWNFEVEAYREAVATITNPIQKRQAEKLLTLVLEKLQTIPPEIKSADKLGYISTLYDLITISRALINNPSNQNSLNLLNRILYGKTSQIIGNLTDQKDYISRGLVNQPWALEIVQAAEGVFEDVLPNEFANQIQRSHIYPIVKENLHVATQAQAVGKLTRTFNDASAQFLSQGNIQQSLALLIDVLEKSPTEQQRKEEIEAWYNYCILQAIEDLLDENGNIKIEIRQALNQNGILDQFEKDFDLRGYLIGAYLEAIGEAGSSKLGNEFDIIRKNEDSRFFIESSGITNRGLQLTKQAMHKAPLYLSEDLAAARKKQDDVAEQELSPNLNPSQHWIARLKLSFLNSVYDAKFKAVGFRNFVRAREDFKATLANERPDIRKHGEAILETIGELSNPFNNIELSAFTQLLFSINNINPKRFADVSSLLKNINRRLALTRLPDDYPNRASDLEYYNQAIALQLQTWEVENNKEFSSQLSLLAEQAQSKLPNTVRAAHYKLNQTAHMESLHYVVWQLGKIVPPDIAKQEAVAKIIAGIADAIQLANNDIVAYMAGKTEILAKLDEEIQKLELDPNYNLVTKHLRILFNDHSNQVNERNRIALNIPMFRDYDTKFLAKISNMPESAAKQGLKDQAAELLRTWSLITTTQDTKALMKAIYGAINIDDIFTAVEKFQEFDENVKANTTSAPVNLENLKTFRTQLFKFVFLIAKNELLKSEEDLNKTDPAQDIIAKSRRLRAIHEKIDHIGTFNPELASQLRDELKNMAKPTAKDRWRFTWTDDPERKVWQEMLLLPKFNGPRGLDIFKGIMYGAFILLGGPVIIIGRNILKSLEGGALELQKLADRGIENLSNYINTPNKPTGLKVLAGIANVALGLFVSYPCKIFRVYSRMITSPIRSAREGDKAGGKPLAILSGLGSFLSLLGIGLLGGYTVIPAMAASSVPAVAAVGTGLQTATTTLGSGASGVVTLVAAEMGKDVVIPAALSPAIGSTIVAAIYSTFVAIKAIGGKIADRIHRNQGGAAPAVPAQQGAQGEGQQDANNHDDRPDREPDVRPASQLPVSNVTTVENSDRKQATQGRGIHEDRFAGIITGQESPKTTKVENTPEPKKQPGRGTYEDRFAEIITGKKSSKTTKVEGTPVEVTGTQTDFSPQHGALETHTIHKSTSHKASGKEETLESYLTSEQGAFRKVMGDTKAKIKLENEITIVITLSNKEDRDTVIANLEKAIGNATADVLPQKDQKQVVIQATSRDVMREVIGNVHKASVVESKPTIDFS